MRRLNIKEWFSPVFFKNPYISRVLNSAAQLTDRLRRDVKTQEDFFKPLL